MDRRSRSHNQRGWIPNLVYSICSHSSTSRARSGSVCIAVLLCLWLLFAVGGHWSWRAIESQVACQGVAPADRLVVLPVPTAQQEASGTVPQAPAAAVGAIPWPARFPAPVPAPSPPAPSPVPAPAPVINRHTCSEMYKGRASRFGAQQRPPLQGGALVLDQEQQARVAPLAIVLRVSLGIGGLASNLRRGRRKGQLAVASVMSLYNTAVLMPEAQRQATTLHVVLTSGSLTDLSQSWKEWATRLFGNGVIGKLVIHDTAPDGNLSSFLYAVVCVRCPLG